MRSIIVTIAAGLALTTFAPPALQAQGRAGDRVTGRVEDVRTRGVDPRQRDRRDDRYDPRRDRRDDRVDPRRGNNARQGGPPFCRNGQGHPVHGMRWCRDKGFASGRVVNWERATWGDVVLRNPRRAERGSVGRTILGDILGDGIYGRVDAHRRALGVTEPLHGRWQRTSGMDVLLLTAGGVPIAEFVDRSGNGRVDIVRINRGR